MRTLVVLLLTVSKANALWANCYRCLSDGDGNVQFDACFQSFQLACNSANAANGQFNRGICDVQCPPGVNDNCLTAYVQPDNSDTTCPYIITGTAYLTSRVQGGSAYDIQIDLDDGGDDLQRSLATYTAADSRYTVKHLAQWDSRFWRTTRSTTLTSFPIPKATGRPSPRLLRLQVRCASRPTCCPT
jgi:hypothetical protein